MPGKILAHLDCASPYSYFALTHLQRIRSVLASHQIDIDIIPVFLGGINHATGNKPPSTLPAKAKYGVYDLARACEHFGTCKLTGPPFFPMVSLLPQRCMCVIKAGYSQEVFESIFGRLWIWVFNRHIDLAQPANMKAVLLDGGELNESQVDEVLRLAGTKEMKGQLNENTRRCIEEYGAFGAPWLWVVRTDKGGKEVLAEPVFGSDRWAYVYKLLGIPSEDTKLLMEKEGNGSSQISVAKL